MFLFVVMLLDIAQTEILAHQRGAYPVAGVLLLSLMVGVWAFLWQPDVSSNQSSPLLIPSANALAANAASGAQTFNMFWQPDWNSLNQSYSSVVQLGVALYGVHVDLLLVQSILLLIAMVGAVQLTLKRRAAAPVHDVFVQHSVDFQKVVYQLKS